METKSAKKKWILRGVIAVLSVIVVAYLGLRLYLSSSWVVAQVKTELQKLYGGRLEVEGAEIGLLGSSTISGLRLFEAEPNADKAWIDVRDIRADLSALGIMAGEAKPNRVTLHEATLKLRWDKDGRFITHLPPAKSPQPATPELLPSVVLKNSRLVLIKETKTEASIENINGTFAKSDDKYILKGDVAGPHWGKWKIEGVFAPEENFVTLDLATEEPVALSRSQLETLPFISDQVWKKLAVEGKSTAKINLMYDAGKGQFDYRVEIASVESTITLPDMDLKVTQITTGKVVVKGWEARIHDVKGKALGGNIQVSGDVNFETADLRVNLPKITLDAVPVKQLPEDWKFPLKMEGDLNATARLSAVLSGDNVKIQGQVDGKIRKKDGGGPKAEFVLDVNATDKGINWSQSSNEANGDKKAADHQPGKQTCGEQGISKETISRVSDVYHSIPFDVLYLCSALTLQEPGQPKKDEKTEQPEKKTDKIELKLKLDDVDIEEYLKTVKLELPFPVKGKMSVEVKTQIPTDDFANLKKYAAQGALKAQNIQIADFYFPSIVANLKYEQGILHLEQLDAPLQSEKGQPAGSILGTAKMELFPLGKLTGEVSAQNIDASQFSDLLPDSALAGAFSGKVKVAVPVDKLQEPAAWSAHADVAANELKGYGLTLHDGQLEFQMEKGVVTVTSLKGTIEETPVEASAALTLAGKYPFEVKVKVTEGDLSVFNRLQKELQPAVKLSGAIDAKLEAAGTLQPLAWKVGGTVKAAKVQAYQSMLERAEFRWSLDDDLLKITDLIGEVYNGKIAGQATIPLEPKQTGAIGLVIQNMKAAPLAKDLKLPFAVDGEVDGALQASMSAANPDNQRDISADLDLASKELKLQGVPVTEIKAAMRLKNDKLEYKIRSKALKGSIELEGNLPLRQEIKKPVGSGVFKMENVDLAQLWQQFGPKKMAVALTGSADVTLEFQHDPGTLLPVGKGQLTITNLQWAPGQLATNLQAELQLGQGELRISNLQSKLAGGTLQGNLNLNLTALERSRFTLLLSGIDAAKLPGLKDSVSGSVNVRLMGTLGNRIWFGRGAVEMSSGQVFKVPAKLLRCPFQWRFYPTPGLGALNVSHATAVVAQGRVTGRGRLNWGRTIGLDAKISFTNLELGNLLQQSLSFGSIGAARVNGKLELSGHNVRSASDLKGMMTADFGYNQAMTFPVLRQVAPFVGRAPSLQFTKGKLRSKIKNSVLYIEELSLESNLLQLFAEGQVTFAQRLDLDVIAKTGQQGAENFGLRFLASKIPAAGPVPVGVIFQATQMLNNRVLHLEVTGTVRNPVVRLRPLRSLSENAIRFFVEQAIPTRSP